MSRPGFRLLTVGQRLFVLILLASMGLVATAIVSLRQIGNVYEAASYAQVNTVPSVTTLDDAQAAFNAMRERVYFYLINLDPADRAPPGAGDGPAARAHERASQDLWRCLHLR